MKYALISDIHANLPALEAVLADIRREGGVDLLVIGGDVYPGPMANEALTAIERCGIPFRAISGNGERVVLETLDGTRTEALPAPAVAGIDWCAKSIPLEPARGIRAWPSTLVVNIPEIGRVVFVHATPRNDTEIFTERTSDDVVRTLFAGVDASVVLCGHTHMQFERRIDGLRIVNAGSVGMPFDEPAAYWALLDGDVRLRRTNYDRAAAAAVLQHSEYPAVDQFIAQYVMTAPSRAQMLDLFTPVSNR